MFLDASRVAGLDDSSEKDGVPRVFVLHLVALEDQSSFELPVGVVRGELRVLLDHDAEDASDMGLLTFLPSFVRHGLPFLHPLWVPGSLLYKLRSFVGEGLGRRRGRQNLLPGH